MRGIFSIGVSVSIAALGVEAVGCSSDSSSASAPAKTHDSGTTRGDSGTPKGDSGTAGPMSGDGGPHVGPGVGQLDGAPQTTLPVLPQLVNVVATERDDSVGIDFDPVEGAIDYRVYPLPDDGDVAVNADGSVTVKNAIYRCAGLRQSFDVANNQNSNGGLTPQSSDGTGLFTSDGNGYAWKTKIPDNPTLGYVYVTPGTDRSAVYALAGYTLENELGWSESRLKIYTTDDGERQKLVGQGWRDDGIAFYVPRSASDETATVYSSETAIPQAGKTYTQYAEFYFLDADKSAHDGDTTPPAPAFQVLKATASGTQPLMAVLYQPVNPHVELAVGKERFQKASAQGPGPLWHLEWSGITKPITLVVEALASGCPFQGFLSPNHLEAPPHQTFYTLDDLRKASPTGEVFINGQYDGPSSPTGPSAQGLPKNGTASLLATSTMSPKAIARSFVSVSPAPHVAADWDWYQGFDVGTDFGDVTTMPREPGSLCGPGSQPSVCGRWQSSTFDVAAYNIDGTDVQVLTYGHFMGQLWEAFDDTGSDVTGKVRFTARQMASIDSDPNKFLHATMSVDIVATGRRYPQLIISDQPAPVQEGFQNPDGNALLFQPIQGPATRIELQAIHGLVNGNGWDVNNQAESHVFMRPDLTDSAQSFIAADLGIDKHMGVDQMTRFDVYASSKRAYLFVDGKQAGCTDYPTGFSISGQVTVTVGDVLYHEGAADELVCYHQRPFPFLHAHQCTETKRHFDDMAFKSGVSAPAWNEATTPCGAY